MNTKAYDLKPRHWFWLAIALLAILMTTAGSPPTFCEDVNDFMEDEVAGDTGAANAWKKQSGVQQENNVPVPTPKTQ